MEQEDLNPQKNWQILVKNLPFKTKWQEVKDLFRNNVGDVSDGELFNDENKKPRGCGILKFPTEDLAKTAVEKMHRWEYKGRKLVVKEDFDTERDKYGRSREDRNNRRNKQGKSGTRSREDREERNNRRNKQSESRAPPCEERNNRRNKRDEFGASSGFGGCHGGPCGGGGYNNYNNSGCGGHNNYMGCGGHSTQGFNSRFTCGGHRFQPYQRKQCFCFNNQSRKYQFLLYISKAISLKISLINSMNAKKESIAPLSFQ